MAALELDRSHLKIQTPDIDGTAVPALTRAGRVKGPRDFLGNIPGYVNYLFKGYYLPRGLITARLEGEDAILHISDTPSFTYPSLVSLIRVLRPGMIVHTGDLVDDLKLELVPGQGVEYREKIGPFLQELESSGAKYIYIVPGNHDQEGWLREQCGRFQIVRDGSVVEFMGFRLGLAHRLEDLPLQGDAGLYGHNMDRPPVGRPNLLNGLNSINVILLPSRQVYKLPYPVGTNQERKYDQLNRHLL